jgi:dolichyldiphosphatase
MLGKGYGMPSSHAQFLSFFAVYLGLFLLLRHRPDSHTHSTPSENSPTKHPIPLPPSHWQIRLLVVAVVLTAAAVAGSRVYLHYHTSRQVLAGVAAGVIAAVAWFVVTGIARATGIVEWLLETRLARQFRVRDLVCGEDLVEAGWLEWERRRRARKERKKKTR